MEKLQKKDIRTYNLPQLKDLFTEMGEKGFRANQVYEWLWKKSARSFDEMSNLTKDLREQLDLNFVINAVKINSSQVSSDRTIKNTFKLHESHAYPQTGIHIVEKVKAIKRKLDY